MDSINEDQVMYSTSPIGYTNTHAHYNREHTPTCSPSPPVALTNQKARIASYQQVRSHRLSREAAVTAASPPSLSAGKCSGKLTQRSISCDTGSAQLNHESSDVFLGSSTSPHRRYLLNYIHRRGLRGNLPTSFR